LDFNLGVPARKSGRKHPVPSCSVAGALKTKDNLIVNASQ
jgi:hypothetical protein